MSRNKTRDSRFNNSLWVNNATYRFHYNRLMGIALSRFKWINLPLTIDERFLEMCLFTSGQAILFKDEVLGILALQVSATGNLDLYGIPTIRKAYSMNGYTNMLSPNNSVMVFNNMMHLPTAPDIELFASRLYECDRTIDVNIKAQKTPVLVKSTETQRLTMMNLYKSYDGNEPFIFADKNLDANLLQVLKTDAPFISDKIQTLKGDIMDEYYTYLGIANVNNDKKERLISKEVDLNMETVDAQRNDWLFERKRACNVFNALFEKELKGKKIDVEFQGGV